jgi:NAD-dependent deacetylase
MEVANIEVFRREPKRFWDYYRPRLGMLGDKKPNPAHQALAELESRGLLEAVITQNIDRLHRKAGSRRVVEVHGTTETSSCLSCGASFPTEDVPSLFDEDGVARCRSCEGPVKPDVVLFGEMLPQQAIEEAYALAGGADLMLCIGTSLEVHPVAGLPALTRNTGGQIAIITKGSTPYDGEAAVRMSGDVVEDLELLLAAL